MTKKILTTILILGLAAATTLIGCEKNTKKEEVRIGVVLPLTGSMAEYGMNARDGLTLAAEKLEKEPSMPRFKLLFQDSKESPQDTVNAVRRLIDVDGVRFIIGGLTSSGVLAAAPYAQQKAVLFFSPAASAPGIPEIGNFIFRNWPGDDAISRKFGEDAFRRGLKNVAILHVSNDYGKTNADGFSSGFQKNGGAVVFRRAFSQGNTDFKDLVSYVAGLPNVDRIFVVGYPDEYRAFFQELHKSSIKPAKILVSDTFYSPDLIRELGSLVEGVICSVASKPGADYQPRNTFIAEYKSRFRTGDGQPKSPGLVSDTAYDAMNLIAKAISQTDGSPGQVAERLLSTTKAYPGAAGPTTFTKDGDITGDLSVFQVADGRFIPWNP